MKKLLLALLILLAPVMMVFADPTETPTIQCMTTGSVDKAVYVFGDTVKWRLDYSVSGGYAAQNVTCIVLPVSSGNYTLSFDPTPVETWDGNSPVTYKFASFAENEVKSMGI